MWVVAAMTSLVLMKQEQLMSSLFPNVIMSLRSNKAGAMHADGLRLPALIGILPRKVKMVVGSCLSRHVLA